MNWTPFKQEESPREQQLRQLFERSAPRLPEDAKGRLLNSCVGLPSRRRSLPAPLLVAGALAVAAVLALVLLPTLQAPPEVGQPPRTLAGTIAESPQEAQEPSSEEGLELPDSPEDWPMLATFALDGRVDEFAMLEMPSSDEDLDSLMQGMEALLME